MKPAHIYTFLGISFALAFPSQAIAPPPSELVNQTTSLECITVSNSFMGNQPAGWGTGSKGPAIEIKNRCPSKITILKILNSPAIEGAEVATPPFNIFVTKADKYLSLKFDPKGDDCALVSAKSVIKSCKNPEIGAGETVLLPMYWGTTYFIEFLASNKIEELKGTLINPRDLKNSLPFLLPAAEKGDPEAQRKLAESYMGFDWNKGIQWLTKAAENGSVEAQWHLGFLFYTNRVKNGYEEKTIPDFTKAAYWFEKAVDKKHYRSGCWLGSLYYSGKGVEKNQEKAMSLWAEQHAIKIPNLTRLADNGDMKSQLALGQIYFKSLCNYAVPDLIAHERLSEESIKWYSKAAEKNDADAQYALYKLYSDNIHDKNKVATSLDWLIKAAENGNHAAEYDLGRMYYDGEHIKQNRDEAIKWYKRAAISGSTEAQITLGAVHRDMQPPQYENAYVWYSIAAQSGNKRNWGARYADEVVGELSPTELSNAKKRIQKWKHSSSKNTSNPREIRE